VRPSGPTPRPLAKPPSLTQRRDFLRVQREGRRFRRERVTLLVGDNSSSTARVGYTVSRRVGESVVRNRVRRRLREIVRLHQELLVLGLDYVIVATPPSAQSSYVELEGDLCALLAACHAWAEKRPRPTPQVTG
jgi:ribonuclease P protein component